LFDFDGFGRNLIYKVAEQQFFLISHLAEVTQRTNRTHSFTDYSTLPVALPSVIAQRSQAVRKK